MGRTGMPSPGSMRTEGAHVLVGGGGEWRGRRRVTNDRPTARVHWRRPRRRRAASARATAGKPGPAIEAIFTSRASFVLGALAAVIALAIACKRTSVQAQPTAWWARRWWQGRRWGRRLRIERAVGARPAILAVGARSAERISGALTPVVALAVLSKAAGVHASAAAGRCARTRRRTQTHAGTRKDTYAWARLVLHTGIRTRGRVSYCMRECGSRACGAGGDEGGRRAHGAAQDDARSVLGQRPDGSLPLGWSPRRHRTPGRRRR